MAIYIKTAKGMDELLSRHGNLNTKFSSVLILVDGVRSDADLRAAIHTTGMPADAIEVLRHGGYIKKDTRGGLKKSGEAVSTAPALSPEQKAFQTLYTHLVEQCKTELGLRGFAMQLSIERASVIAELNALIEPLSEAIAKRHGLQVAQQFLRNIPHAKINGLATDRRGLRLIADRTSKTPAAVDFHQPSDFQKTVISMG